MMLDAFADLARRQRTLLVGTVAPAPVWHITALTVERFPGTLLNPVILARTRHETYTYEGIEVHDLARWLRG